MEEGGPQEPPFVYERTEMINRNVLIAAAAVVGLGAASYSVISNSCPPVEAQPSIKTAPPSIKALPQGTTAVPQSMVQVQLTFAPVVKRVAPAVVNVYARSVVRQQV